MNNSLLWVAGYDISHDGRRLKLARLLACYGDRVQRSLFILRLNTGQLKVVLDQVTGLITGQDAFHLFRLCGACRDGSLLFGDTGLPALEPFWVV